MNAGMHANIVVGLIVYGCLMLALSVFWMVRTKKATDYLVAGRGQVYWILTGTIIAGSIGTGIVIGASGLAYQHGWAGCAYPLGLGFGTIITGLCFAKMRHYGFITLSEEISCYYEKNRAVVEFCNISLFFSQLCWLTVQIMGGGRILGIVTGLSPQLCVVLSGLIISLIAIPGGYRTIAYTDFVNAIILLSGFGFLLHSALAHSGGWNGLRQSVPPSYSSFLGYASLGTLKLVSLLVVLMLSDISDPGRRLAIYSAHTESIAKKATVTAGSVVMLFSIVIGVAGMYAYKINPHLPSPDLTLPWLILHALPSGLGAVVVVSVMAAILSCANSNAFAVGSFFVRHIFPLATGHYPKKSVPMARKALACALVVSTLVALHTSSIVDFIIKFLPVTMSGISVIILMGRFWKRANWQGALAALLTTPVISLLVISIPALTKFWGYPAIPAVIAGAAVQFLVSTLTSPTSVSFEKTAETISRERQAVEQEPAGGQPANTANNRKSVPLNTKPLPSCQLES